MEDIKQLKAENEKLRVLYDTYRTCYQAKHGDIKCLFIKYKQALKEIKELAEENKDTSQYGGICKSILNLIAKIS